MTDGLAGYAAGIRAVFPSVKHLLCLFHHHQGVSRWLRAHTADLPTEVVVRLKRKMKHVVQTCDPRTVRRRLGRLATVDGAQDGGLDAWIALTAKKLDTLVPALRKHSYPRTTTVKRIRR